MSSVSTNNKRIAKNTLMLYVRMGITMVVTLFTSRVVLEALGENDFGIYNVVGGVVSLFSILSGSLSGAITRFITYELGRGNKERLKTIFSTSVNIQLLMALIIFILCEIIGVWFLNEKMNIPEGRMGAANFVLQCSIVTFCVNLINIPYNATIIAHEKMDVFAYISILEVSLKLAIAYAIYISGFDKLKVYALLILLTSVLIPIIYGVYCNRTYKETKYSFVFDISLFKEMASFAGWNLFGNTAYILNTQGINMLINIFFGVAINAARAIAVQVDSAVTMFVSNFMTALNPQITKYYASGEYERMVNLVCRGTRFSFYIMYFFIVPIVLETETILGIWLKEVPDETSIFLRLVLFASLTVVIGTPLYTAIQATGHIRRYQIVVTAVGCLVFPLTWLGYGAGCPAYITYVIFIFIYFFLNFIRLASLKRLMNFPIMQYLRTVYIPIGICAVICFIVPAFIVYAMPSSLLRFILVTSISCVWSGLCIFYAGLEKDEQVFFVSKARGMIKDIRAK